MNYCELFHNCSYIYIQYSLDREFVCISDQMLAKSLLQITWVSNNNTEGDEQISQMCLYTISDRKVPILVSLLTWNLDQGGIQIQIQIPKFSEKK